MQLSFRIIASPYPTAYKKEKTGITLLSKGKQGMTSFQMPYFLGDQFRVSIVYAEKYKWEENLQ